MNPLEYLFRDKMESLAHYVQVHLYEFLQLLMPHPLFEEMVPLVIALVLAVGSLVLRYVKRVPSARSDGSICRDNAASRACAPAMPSPDPLRDRHPLSFAAPHGVTQVRDDFEKFELQNSASGEPELGRGRIFTN